jgi:hypothetical protein
MFEIWDGNLMLYTVDTKYEAVESGFEVRTVGVPQ